MQEIDNFQIVLRGKLTTVRNLCRGQAMKLRLSLPPIVPCEDIAFLQELALNPVSYGRDVVLYDENIQGYAVLESSDSHAWQRKVIRLVISSPSESVPEKAFDEDADAQVPGANKLTPYALYETSLTDSDVVLRDFERDDKVYTIWKFLLTLKYPNMKLLLPFIAIDCFLENIVPGDEAKPISSGDNILPDYMPVSEANLLSELRLSDQGVLKVPASLLKESKNPVVQTEPTPASPSKNVGLGIILPPPEASAEEPEAVRASLRVPVLVSLGLKLRSAKPTRKGTDLLTSVTVEASDELCQTIKECGLDDSYFFCILNLDMPIRNGVASRILADDLTLPMRFDVNDVFSLTYRLTSNDLMIGAQSNPFKKVTIILKSQLMRRVNNKDIPISGEITTEWAPYVDFGIQPPPINSALKKYATGSQSVNTLAPTSPRNSAITMRNKKQKNIQAGGYDSPRLLPSASHSTPNFQGNGTGFHLKAAKFMPMAPTSSSVTVNLATGNNSVISGLKISFMGKFNITLGDTVEWVVLATNTSNNIIDATLIISDVSEFRNSSKLYNPPQVSSAIPKRSSEETTDSLYSRAQLNNAYQAEKTITSGVLVLDNDLRLGPLEPRQVCERTLRLAGITKGIFSLRGLKVIDTHRGSGVDFGKLVQVFVI